MSEPENTEVMSAKEKEFSIQLREMVNKEIAEREKRDYRATVVHREERAEPPDAFTTFINVNENNVDEMGYPRELDVKGTQTPFDVYQSCAVELGTEFAELIDWQYHRVQDSKGKWHLQEVDLAKASVISRKWNNMGLFGQQSTKHLNGLRASAGLTQDDSPIKQNLKWFGFVRKNKADMAEQYGEQP